MNRLTSASVGILDDAPDFETVRLHDVLKTAAREILPLDIPP